LILEYAKIQLEIVGNVGIGMDTATKKKLGGDTPTVEHAKINSEMDW